MSEHQLSQCREGSTGFITKVEGDSGVTARLQEMGVLPGQRFRILRSGNPVIFQIGDSRLCVRASQLDGVSVHPVGPISQPKPNSGEYAAIVDNIAPMKSVRSDI